MAHNTKSAKVRNINAKRNTVTPRRIRERYEAGEDVSKDRALVRMGVLNTRILTGQEDLSLWDDEELKRGQRRDKNGNLVGKAPVVVPKVLHDELVRRTLSRIEELMRESALEATKAIVDIMKGQYQEGADDPKAKDRLRAAEMILARVMGKEPMRIQISAIKSTFEEAFDAMLVPDDTDEAIEVDSWEADDGDET